MLNQDVQAAPAGSGMPLPVAVGLQDHLMVASNDLDRLERLLGDASDALLGHFHGANQELRTLLNRTAEHPELDTSGLHEAMSHLTGAITAMQFQDVASQLVQHTTRRLRGCAERLAADAFPDDEVGPAVIDALPLRPNPVTQDAMDAGSVELF